MGCALIEKFMDDGKNMQSLIPLPDASLANTTAGAKRILSEMIGETLTLGREEAVARTARFRIGDYVWCEPDYRQILLWAEALKMDPLIVVEKLFADRNLGKDQIQDGRMHAISWQFPDLPLLDFRCIEGLTIESFKLSNFGTEVSMLEEIQTQGIALSLRSLRIFRCSYCKIGALGLFDLPNLRELECLGNMLLELDLTRLPNLTTLSCRSNRLTRLDLSHVPNLRSLNCGDNELAELDLSKIPNLREIECDPYLLAKLNFSQVPNLTSLCSYQGDQPMKLDLSRVPNLTNLNCGGNMLTELALIYVPNLTKLSCWNNQLKKLDLSKVQNLTELYCTGNRLTKLDLSQVPHLTQLRCSENAIAELDIRPLLSLEDLDYDADHTRLLQRPDQNF